MPKCRNCGTRLSKLDNDICPVCGIDNPFQGVNSETIEITSQISSAKEEYDSYKPLYKIIAVLLFLLCGFTGAPLFYLKYNKQGIIWLFLNIVIFAIIFLLLYFVAKISLLFAILIPIFTIYGINILLAIALLLKKNIKANNGEFLK